MGLDHKIYLAKKGIKLSDESILKDYYFRKVNCLQNYFEKKYDVQNCVPQLISINDITHINNVVKEILKDKNVEKAKELFPIVEGFFYGSTKYDEGYFENLQDIQNVTDEILNTNLEEIDIYYNCWY